MIDVVREAGRQIAAEFARPSGPRFSDHVTAPLDREIEMMLREHLLCLLPARFVGEEAGVLEAPANGYCWVVDPHDGTRAFLEGKRGSAVSVALLHRGVPVLAVVHAPTSPDRGSDLISWALDGPIARDGGAVSALPRRDLAAGDVVFLNHGAWQRPVWHSTACAPAGFMPLPSIAYRLARVAVGDGIATQTLRPVNALDIAAGHALLMAAGGVLVAEDGTPVTYDDLGFCRPSACFGGSPESVATLRARTWRGSTEPRREARVVLAWPRTVREDVLDRAVGCLLGLAIGTPSPPDVAPADPNVAPGGPDIELAVVMARALAGKRAYDQAAVDAAIADWIASGGRADQASPLARAIAIGLWAGDPALAADTALRDLPNAIDNPGLAVAVASGSLDGRPVVGVPDDTPSIAGALMGLAHGRRFFAVGDVLRVLTWRPGAASGVVMGGVGTRPETCWTDDLVDLAEALLTRNDNA